MLSIEAQAHLERAEGSRARHRVVVLRGGWSLPRVSQDCDGSGRGKCAVQRLLILILILIINRWTDEYVHWPGRSRLRQHQIFEGLRNDWVRSLRVRSPRVRSEEWGRGLAEGREVCIFLAHGHELEG